MSKLESLPASPGIFGGFFTILILLISPTVLLVIQLPPKKEEDGAWPVLENVSSLPDPGDQ